MASRGRNDGDSEERVGVFNVLINWPTKIVFVNIPVSRYLPIYYGDFLVLSPTQQVILHTILYIPFTIYLFE